MNIIIVSVLVSIVSQSLAQIPICGSSNEADSCMQKLLLLGDPKFKYPQSRDEMDVHCKNVTKYQTCIKEYSQKCLDTFARQVTSVLAFGIVKTNKGYCNNQRNKQSFISFGRCGNHIKPMGDKCMHNYIDNLQGIENHRDNKLKIPLVCCNYFSMKDCILNHVRKASPQNCNDHNYAELERLIDGFAMDTLDLICGDYTEDSDKCQTIIAQTPRKLSSQKRSKSLLVPFIAIFSSV